MVHGILINKKYYKLQNITPEQILHLKKNTLALPAESEYSTPLSQTQAYVSTYSSGIMINFEEM